MATLGTKQARFAAEYSAGNVTGKEAAIRAGYSPATAESQASRLLRNLKVQAEIDRLRTKVAEKLELNAEKVLRPLKEISESDLIHAFKEDGTFKALKDIPPEVRRAISGIEIEELKLDGVSIGRVVKLKLWPKVQALELLGKNQKLFTDKVEHAGADGKPLSFAINFGSAKR